MILISFGRKLKQQLRGEKATQKQKQQKLLSLKTAQWRRLFNGFEATPEGSQLRESLNQIKKWNKAANDTQLSYLRKLLAFARTHGAYPSALAEIESAIKQFRE